MITNEKPEIKDGNKVMKVKWIHKLKKKLSGSLLFLCLHCWRIPFQGKIKKYNKMDGNWITYLCFCMRNNYMIESPELHSHREQKYQVRALPFLAILTRDVLPPWFYILNLNRSSTNCKQLQTCIYCTISHL